MASETPLPGRSYRLRNKGTGTYLTSAHFSPTENATVWGKESAGQGKLAQTWHLLSLDNGWYILQQKLGGNVLTNSVGGWLEGKAPSDLGWELVGLTPPYAPPSGAAPADTAAMDGQTFKLYREPDNSFWITSKSSTQNLAAGDDGNIYLATWNSGWGQRQQWFLEPEDEYRQVTGAQVGQAPGILKPVPNMTDYARPQPDATEPVLIGTTLLPSALIHDPGFEGPRMEQEQAQQSPWYFVRRYGFYRIGYYYDHSGTSAVTEEKTVTFGLTRTDASSVEETTGISVTAEASFGFKGFGASISTTYSHELRTRTAQETVQSSTKETRITRQFNEGYRSALAIWYRTDRYVLQRMDGTQVLDWETTVQDDSVERAYAPDKPASGPARPVAG
ncbi:hypothetical protein [Streptomyces sp. NPDC088557]|uniref:hypothetical protein n=1 Tax=Streptomyces sp. NPDC088557 TaxID=3365867 RepID=UPI0037F40B37